MYGWIYYPLVYSEVHVEDDNDIPESDVYFVGKAKDRLSEIISFFEKCDAAGLKCDFHLVDVLINENLLNGSYNGTYDPVKSHTGRKCKAEYCRHNRHEIVHHLHGLLHGSLLIRYILIILLCLLGHQLYIKPLGKCRKQGN